MKPFHLTFGALSPPIEEQCRTQGIELPDADKYQRLLDAVTLLYLHGMLSEGGKKAAHKSLFHKIEGVLKANDLSPLQTEDNS